MISTASFINGIGSRPVSAMRPSASSGCFAKSGDAAETPPVSGRWVYTATENAAQGSTVRISVLVSDQPGGTSEATFEKSL